MKIFILFWSIFLKIVVCDEKLFVCYYTNWAQYRPQGGKFMPEQINASLCTHIVYAFAKVVDDRLVAYEWNDEDTEWSKGLYSKTIDLKKQNPRLKVLIGVGGWNHGPEAFSVMVHDIQKREKFVRHCVNFIKRNRFDGLDLDWEYPGSREGSRPTDKQLFTILVKELREAFEPFNFLLTAAVAAGHENINKAYEIDKLAQYFDFICLMAYDFHGSWEQTIDHNSPLYSRKSEYGDASYLNVDWAVNYWLKSGFPKEKFVLGLATYGRPFKLKDPNSFEPGDLNDGAGTPGKFTREKGFLSYYEICKKILSDGWTKKWSDEQMVPYAYGQNEWVGFEDIESLRIKARYINEMGLAGAMIWSLSLDDFSGAFCNEGKYPLINAIRNELQKKEIKEKNSDNVIRINHENQIKNEKEQNNEINDNKIIYPQVNNYITDILDQEPFIKNLNEMNDGFQEADRKDNVYPYFNLKSNDKNYQKIDENLDLIQNVDEKKIVGEERKEKLFVCYYTNWAQYRPQGGKFMPEQINASLCTHIVYAFAKVVDDRLVAYEWNDEDTEWSKGLYSKTIDLKKQNPRLKVLIGVGGWNHGPEAFSVMVHDIQKREKFVRHCVNFIKRNRFDGLDLDWEYPGSREGSRPTDKELFTILVKELREAFEPFNFFLTAAVAAGHENINKAYEIDKLAQYFDFICLMAYDFHGSWEQTIDHNSPLYSRKSEYGDASYLNVDWAVNYWLKSGFPKEKFVLGLATYGRPFKLKDPNSFEPGDLNDGAGTPGKFTREKGFLSYYEICKKILSDGWTKKWSDEQMVPYAYGQNEWVGFEDIESLRIKARYINEMGLAGAMIWSLSLDDFSGAFCNEGKYPLINAIREVLFSDTDQKNLFISSKPNVSNYSNLLDRDRDESDGLNSDRVDENFECFEDGLFADKSSGCRAFFQCFRSMSRYVLKARFLCPIGTLFNQEKLVCDWPNYVICS